MAVAKPRYPLPEHTWSQPGANCSTHSTYVRIFIKFEKSYVLIMGLINVTPKSITLRSHATEHETIDLQAPDSRRILSATYFKSIYQVWGCNICTCGLDHSGSEPFNYGRMCQGVEVYCIVKGVYLNSRGGCNNDFK